MRWCRFFAIARTTSIWLKTIRAGHTQVVEIHHLMGEAKGLVYLVANRQQHLVLRGLQNCMSIYIHNWPGDVEIDLVLQRASKAFE